MSCDVCDDSGTGPDGSYCRVQGCVSAELSILRDSNTELVDVLAVVDGWRLKEAESHTATIRELHALRFQFQKYGRHHRSCTKRPCSCGFDAVKLSGVRL